MYVDYFLFFFQAEDGIRDYKVTGVQTCALPIFADGVTVDQARREVSEIAKQMKRELGEETWMTDATLLTLQEQIVGRSRGRSEERRVGKEWRTRRAP